ncbi:carboxymuconolactone decarboxylase family protein [Pedobacter metabolipauper]|uniref:Alkylhydroperoxidase/carboxymuconolactone decarboxylase family protein YurZ n=1 Tax=Pedobacter metabolipauper TaxID=425513 RepID=A0A4R6SUI2_9SPHI|nr:carboxymuconolactone decarboxylase family protein [Pedobacter metabolipauper]TDQ08698.1 alkylhydroperoxidase/carboxymuconolactone decarboxylase family protein YurZ [Pedobacter metabolipauper]
MNIYKKIKGLTTLIVTLVMSSSVNAQETVSGDASLTSRQQSLITISAYTAKGDLVKLKAGLNTALDGGLTINEAKEAIIHLYAYCGFPRSIRGLQTLMAVLTERKAKGINDKMGAESTPLKDDRSKYERGKEILGKLTGAPQDGPATGYAAFAPEIEIFLKEHLFADIFERDILSYTDRELVTVAVLSSIGGAEPMLRSHLTICLNVGLKPGQLHQFVGVIRSAIGKKEAEAAQKVLDEILINKK